MSEIKDMQPNIKSKERSTIVSKDFSVSAKRDIVFIQNAKISKRIFIGGLNWSLCETDLKVFFSKYGLVASAQILRDAKGLSRGFGFVSFAETPDKEKQEKFLISYANLLKTKFVVIDNRRAEIKEAFQEKVVQRTNLSYNSDGLNQHLINRKGLETLCPLVTSSNTVSNLEQQETKFTEISDNLPVVKQSQEIEDLGLNSEFMPFAYLNKSDPSQKKKIGHGTDLMSPIDEQNLNLTTTCKQNQDFTSFVFTASSDNSNNNNHTKLPSLHQSQVIDQTKKNGANRSLIGEYLEGNSSFSEDGKSLEDYLSEPLFKKSSSLPLESPSEISNQSNFLFSNHANNNFVQQDSLPFIPELNNTNLSTISSLTEQSHNNNNFLSLPPLTSNFDRSLYCSDRAQFQYASQQRKREPINARYCPQNIPNTFATQQQLINPNNFMFQNQFQSQPQPQNCFFGYLQGQPPMYGYYGVSQFIPQNNGIFREQYENSHLYPAAPDILNWFPNMNFDNTKTKSK